LEKLNGHVHEQQHFGEAEQLSLLTDVVGEW
jgi:hypothetical protein